MDTVHLAIGVTGVVALIILISNSVAHVSSQVVDRTGPSVSDLVARGSPVSHQLTGVEPGRDPPLMEGEIVDTTCSVVKDLTSTACSIVGQYLPRLPSLSKNSEEVTDADTKAEPKPGAAAPSGKDPPAEEAE